MVVNAFKNVNIQFKAQQNDEIGKAIAEAVGNEIQKELAKEDITIFEMKKADTTLEDAFMKLIEGGNK